MTSLLYKWILGKTVGKIHVGGTTEDPFFEEIPHEELGYFRKQGAKRKRPPPAGLSANDAKVLMSVRSRAYNLDLALSCCCGIQIGWAGVIGLLPWVGDIIAAYFAIALVRRARDIDGGLPQYIEAQMMANVMFDFCIGLIPLVGDLVNIAYKANTRNCILLESHLKSHGIKPGANHEMATAAGQRELPNEQFKDHGTDQDVNGYTNSQAFQKV